jgi:hypothetical protein
MERWSGKDFILSHKLGNTLYLEECYFLDGFGTTQNKKKTFVTSMDNPITNNLMIHSDFFKLIK